MVMGGGRGGAIVIETLKPKLKFKVQNPEWNFETYTLDIRSIQPFIENIPEPKFKDLISFGDCND